VSRKTRRSVPQQLACLFAPGQEPASSSCRATRSTDNRGLFCVLTVQIVE